MLNLYNMKLGDHEWSSEMNCEVLRVPGGWIFRNINGTDAKCYAFVPFNNEFMEYSDPKKEQLVSLSKVKEVLEERDDVEPERKFLIEHNLRDAHIGVESSKTGVVVDPKSICVSQVMRAWAKACICDTCEESCKRSPVCKKGGLRFG